MSTTKAKATPGAGQPEVASGKEEVAGRARWNETSVPCSMRTTQPLPPTSMESQVMLSEIMLSEKIGKRLSRIVDFQSNHPFEPHYFPASTDNAKATPPTPSLPGGRGSGRPHEAQTDALESFKARQKGHCPTFKELSLYDPGPQFPQ